MIINFVAPGVNMDPQVRLDSAYGNVIRSILQSILCYLPEGVVSPQPLPSAVNIHFFFEGSSTPGSKCVFVQHGLADKCLISAKTVGNFDYVCVSGPAWLEKLKARGVDTRKVITIGYPSLDPLFHKPRAEKKSGRKTILYAPTHANSKASSYPAFLECIDKLPDEYKILVSAHPYHGDDHMPTMEKLISADVVIADCGSTVYEAWSLGKPVVFPDWLCRDKVLKVWPDSFEADIYRRRIGYHASDFEHLVKLLELAVARGITEEESNFINGIFPQALRGCSGELAAATLRKIASEGRTKKADDFKGGG